MFQRVGAVAFKKDLTNTLALCETLGNPQRKFKTIHVAGTNGKGSSSHMLASILQEAGYKTGLYTSPHLKEFTERIRIDGREVSKEFVVDFVARLKPEIEAIKPSFFEITVAMAFDYFARQQVDIAVIEVGLGGRLDSTNVITPEVSLITNIGWDHMDLLGDTLPKIAWEKAGIIKPKVPVVISERQPEVVSVFSEKASMENAPITFAADGVNVIPEEDGNYRIHENGLDYTVHLDLKGSYQRKNIAGVIATTRILQSQGFVIQHENILNGLSNTIQNTSLKGRWQKLGDRPLIVCDTGHNEDGIREVMTQINQQTFNQLYMVIGMVRDKDITKVLQLLPKSAYYFFCQANIPRAMDCGVLKEKAETIGLNGEIVKGVNQALQAARQKAKAKDMIFVGGSTFVVAEVNEL